MEGGQGTRCGPRLRGYLIPCTSLNLHKHLRRTYNFPPFTNNNKRTPLFGTHQAPGTVVLSISYIRAQVILTAKPYTNCTSFVICILPSWKRQHRKVKSLAQGHTAGRRWSQYNPRWSAPVNTFSAVALRGGSRGPQLRRGRRGAESQFLLVCLVSKVIGSQGAEEVVETGRRSKTKTSTSLGPAVQLAEQPGRGGKVGTLSSG